MHTSRQRHFTRVTKTRNSLTENLGMFYQMRTVFNIPRLYCVSYLKQEGQKKLKEQKGTVTS